MRRDGEASGLMASGTATVRPGVDSITGSAPTNAAHVFAFVYRWLSPRPEMNFEWTISPVCDTMRSCGSLLYLVHWQAQNGDML